MLKLFPFTGVLLLALQLQPALAAERIDLSPGRAAKDLARVNVELEAGGHNLIRAAENGKASEQKLPTSVSAKLQYDELRFSPSGNASDKQAILAVRHYETAEAVLKVDDSGRTPKLAKDRRLIVLARRDGETSLYSPEGPVLREQLDLIDVVGNSFYVDQLLPGKAVADGETWSHEAELMGRFLSLDSVAVCEVTSVLDEHNSSFAKVRLAGVVHGMADGAAIEVELRALYLYDRRRARVTRLNLAVREKRSIGGATPGLDAVAKLQIKIEPIESSSHLTEKAVARATTGQRTPTRDVLYEAAPLGFRVRHDRQWYVTSEQRESVTLRRVDRGDLVAQCTLTALPAKSAGRQATLEQFQKDVEFSLGKSFGELVSSRQWQNAAGHYCYEVVARGIVEEVPVEWHYYLVAPASGDRVSAAVTIEKPMVERVAGADRALIESLELFPRMPAAATAAARDEAKPVR